MKKSVSVIACICLLLFVAGSAMAGQASAKFAATWSTEPGVASVAYIPDTSTDAIDLDWNMGYTLAKIKVPQDKELLVGLSAEIGLVTDTSIKGKQGGTAKAIAGGKANVTIFAIPEPFNWEGIRKAEPGRIMLSSRFQVLTATLGGVLTSLDPLAFTDEEIGFLQGTLAAHHFNFLLPNMDQGVYKIVAFFTTGAIAKVDICELCDGSVSASAFAAAIIGKTMLTAQQVRAVKDSLEEVTIIEP